MSVVAAIRQMMAKGFTMEQALTAAEIMEANAPIDAQADRRRAKDRERKRLRNSAESAESAETPLPSPNGPPPQTPPPLNPPSCPDQAPARQAEPEAGQGKIDYEEVQRWASGLVGSNPVALNFDISPVISLLRAGFSRERVEIGIKAAVAAAKQPIRSWKSFDGWVRNTAADAAPIAKPIDLETQWRNKLKRWNEKGDWPPVWGDPPGHPCCSIPAAFIASHADNWNREAAE